MNMVSQSYTEVMRRLNHFNEWWSQGNVPKRLLKDFRRRDFYKIRDNLSKNKITILIGPRRVGKTIIMRQLIDDFIRKKDNSVPPKNILYAKMDDYLLNKYSESNLELILDVYAQNVLGMPFEKTEDSIYLFLDEIHKFHKWEQQIKDIYDQGYNIVFLITGSSSPAIFKDKTGILTGRYRTQIMLPMKFVDVVNIDEQDKITERKYNLISVGLRRFLTAAIRTGDGKKFFEQATKAFAILSANEKQIEIHLRNYIIRGGYPELYDKGKSFDLDECADSLYNQLRAILSQDILEVFQVRNPEKILNLFQLVGSQTAQIRKYKDMAEKLGITKTDTLKDYLGYLKQTYLIGIAELYSNNVDTTKKSNKKIYVMDAGLRNVSLGVLNKSLLERPEDVGKVVETIVFDHCNRLKYNLDLSLASKNLYYWRRNGNEVDIIIPTKTKPIPIEVKYRRRPSTYSIKLFMEKYGAPFGIIVTKNKLDFKDDVLYIPLWLFLFLC